MTRDLQFAMPSAVGAEKTILGAIMLDNKMFYEAAEQIDIEDFYLDAHRRIFACMAAVVEDQKAIDIITVTDRLEKRGEVNAVGGVAYVSSLIDGVPHQPSISSYTKIVRDKALLRKAIHCGLNIQSQASEHFADAQEVISQANEAAMNLTLDQRKRLAEPLSAIMPRMLKELYEYRKVDAERDAIGLRTGLKALDKKTTGYRLGEYVIVSGGTADGKTSMAIQAIIANLYDDVPTLLFSHEMTSEAIAMRILAAVGELEHSELRDSRSVNMFEIEKLPKLCETLGKWPLWVDDASGLHVREIVARIRAFVRRNKVKLVVVDYIQLVKGDGESSTERLTDVSGHLREIAKDEKIALLALCQYGRMENKTKRRPTLMDLKGASSLEQDAHMVLACYRPQDENMVYRGNDEIIILKQRNGPTGLGAAVTYDKRKLLFEPREDRHKDE